MIFQWDNLRFLIGETFQKFQEQADLAARQAAKAFSQIFFKHRETEYSWSQFLSASIYRYSDEELQEQSEIGNGLIQEMGLNVCGSADAPNVEKN